uniref:Uncharacterized protein n=1 Tax=Arundo donax TaxID=35708 RepID=A0A0A9FG08_ARUDO
MQGTAPCKCRHLQPQVTVYYDFIN